MFFCHTEAEATLHVFYKCSSTKILWNQLLSLFETDLDFSIQHDILLIFKLFVYQPSERGVLNLNSLIRNVTKVKKLLLLYVRKRRSSLIINGNQQT